MSEPQQQTISSSCLLHFGNCCFANDIYVRNVEKVWKIAVDIETLQEDGVNELDKNTSKNKEYSEF